MCFFTEAQQRAFDAIQQRRAQAAAQAVQVSGFNPYAPPAACAAPAPAPAAPAQAAPATDDSAAAKVAHAFANTSPQFVTRFIQEVVQQQLQQAASHAAPFSMAHHSLDASGAAAVPSAMSTQDSVKRSMEESMAGEPMIKRQKYISSAAPASAVALMMNSSSEDAGSSSDSEKQGKKQKRRFVWTADLRDLFDRAVASMEPELVGPKNIYKYMSRLAPAMVRDSEINTQHIKSHLQKWRIARRRGLPLNVDCGNGGNNDDMMSMMPPQQPSLQQQPPQSSAPSDRQFMSNPSEVPSNSCATTVYSYQAPAPSVSISPESAVVPSHPPNPSFQSPPAPVPKALDLEPPLLLDDFDQTCDPLLSSWDSLFSDSPAEESLVPAASSGAAAPSADGDMLMPPLPSDVLAELSKAVGGSNAGLSTSEILKYMMLGYQLGYQNCFTELAPSDNASESGAVVSGNTTTSSLSLF